MSSSTNWVGPHFECKCSTIICWDGCGFCHVCGGKLPSADVLDSGCVVKPIRSRKMVLVEKDERREAAIERLIAAVGKLLKDGAKFTSGMTFYAVCEEDFEALRKACEEITEK